METVVEVQIVDHTKRIIRLIWSDIVSYSDVTDAITYMQQCHLMLHHRNFYLLMDASSLSLFTPDTKYVLSQFQEQYASYIDFAAFVSGKEKIFEQWRETHKRDSYQLQCFSTSEEACHYLFSL